MKTFAALDLKFKESKPRDAARNDLLKATWQSQKPKPPPGEPPQPEGRVFLEKAGRNPPHFTQPPAVFKAPPHDFQREDRIARKAMEGELAVTAQKIVDAVAILGIDNDFDFERGCVGALQVAAEQKLLLEKTLLMVTDFPHHACLSAQGLITTLDAAIASLPQFDGSSKIDKDARKEVLRELEELLKQSHSIVRITEEALASKVAAKAPPEEPHHVPFSPSRHSP